MLIFIVSLKSNNAFFKWNIVSHLRNTKTRSQLRIKDLCQQWYFIFTSDLFFCLKLLNQSCLKVEFQFLVVNKIVSVKHFKEHTQNLLCFPGKSQPTFLIPLSLSPVIRLQSRMWQMYFTMLGYIEFRIASRSVSAELYHSSKKFWGILRIHLSSHDCYLFDYGIWKIEGFVFGCLGWRRICPYFDLSVISSLIEDIFLFLGWSPKSEVWSVGWVKIFSVYILLIV